MSNDIALRGVAKKTLPIMFYITKCPKCSEHALIVPAVRLSLNKVLRHVNCEACGYIDEIPIKRKGDKLVGAKVNKKK